MRGTESAADLAARAQRGDEAARKALLEAMQPTIASAARRLARLAPAADLRQAGAVGVLTAIRGFDPGRGASFEAYAARFVLGEMLAFVRQSATPVRVPRGVRAAAREVDAAIERFQLEHRRSPTVDELATATGLDAEAVIDALQARRGFQPLPVEDERVAAIGADDEALTRAEQRLDLGHGLRALDARSRAVLALRFGADLSQSEIAARVGVSQMHISRLLRAALAELERALDA